MIEALTGALQSAITIVLFLLILGVLVIVHEFGHFAVARLAGVRVLEFGIGFPPRAKVLRSEGETLYTLNWLPIGGFVKLEGEDGGSDDPRAFSRAPLPKRLLILIAGVSMNLLLALAIFGVIALLPGKSIGMTFQGVQGGSPAWSAGLQPTTAASAGDQIIAIDGHQFHDFDGGSAMIDELRSHAGQSVSLTLIRADGNVQDVTVALQSPAAVEAGKGALGISGIAFRPTDRIFNRPPVDALAFAGRRTTEAFGLIVEGLGQLADSIVSHPTQPPPVQGPVGIAVGVGDVFWQAGPIATLFVAGLLSANLALVNVLPLPPLDGGRILVILIKSIAGKRVSLQAERLTYLVGFGFLMALLLWITYFDIARIGGQ
jgi:regulator of sigma E protease